MEEYIYDETKYIKRQDLNDFIDQMSKYDFAPEEIESQSEFNIVFQLPRPEKYINPNTSVQGEDVNKSHQSIFVLKENFIM